MNREEKIIFLKEKERRAIKNKDVLETEKIYKNKKLIITDESHPYYNRIGKFKRFSVTENGLVIEVRINWFISCYVFSMYDIKFI